MIKLFHVARSAYCICNRLVAYASLKIIVYFFHFFQYLEMRRQRVPGPVEDFEWLESLNLLEFWTVWRASHEMGRSGSSCTVERLGRVDDVRQKFFL